ncbi:odorant receptor 82a-like [Bradysia coprophila]|uniref:odorant receptor 82a-like n=1 Tax=Bradysia coprophila TaxID=38358 RepID=UPI00187DAC9D|nr:odorant receptor 82a-like [Bradysia coprophila]
MYGYDDLLNPIKRNFQLGMINFLDVNWKANVWSAASLFLMGTLVCGTCTYFCRHVTVIENIQDAAEAGVVFGSAFALYVKLIVSLLKRKELISFSDSISQQYSQSLNEHPDITNVFARHFSLITKVFSVVVCLLPILYTITSLVGNDEPRHPIFMEFPFFPSKGWPFYHIIYLMQIIIMGVGCNLALGVEFLTFFFIQYVCCRIEILAHMVEHWNGKLEENHCTAKRNNLLLEEIVRYHSSVKRNMAAIKRIFSPGLMATLLTNSMVICMCLFIISVNPLPKICSHIVFALTQTFMYCFVGNLLKNQNDNLVEKVMLIDFYYLDVPERKSYMNVVQSSCNPIKLQSYFVTVDMALFFKVVKFAYSVFSLMKTRI